MIKKIVLCCVTLFVFDSFCFDPHNFFFLKLLDDYHDRYDEQEGRNVDKPSRYDKLINDALQRPFRAQGLFSHAFDTDEAFDCSGNKVCLSDHLFGMSPIYLSDVFLPAKLAKDGLLSAPTDENPTICTTLCDQFLPQLADLEINFCAERTTTTFDIALAYAWNVWRDKIDLLLGGNVPIVRRKHKLDMQLLKGGLSDAEFNDTGESISLFFKEFSSVQDFVTGFVFEECKNLCWQQSQTRTGVGDLSLFAALDFGSYLNDDSQAMVGLNIFFPTSNKAKGNTIWEIELGNGGAWTINPFIDIDYHYNNYVNPHLFLAGFFRPSFDAIRRVPEEIKTDANILGADTDLCLPGTLTCYTIKPFCSIDSCSALLADKASCVCVSKGHGGMVRIGNNFYDIFNSTLELGIFYSFNFKQGDCVAVKTTSSSMCDSNSSSSTSLRTGTFNTSKLPETSSSYAHVLDWRLAHRLNDYVGWSVGSRHVLGGKNTIQTHALFAKLAIYF